MIIKFELYIFNAPPKSKSFGLFSICVYRNCHYRAPSAFFEI